MSVQTNKAQLIPSEKLSLILDPSAKPCVTFYIPRVSKTFNKQERKNLFLAFARQAEEVLKRDHSFEFSQELIKRLWLSNPYAELDKYHCAVGFFHNSQFTGLLPLNGEIDPKVIVADSFHIKPILGWLQETPPHYLLTLSSREIRIYEGDAWDLRFVKSITDETNEQSKKSQKVQTQEFFHRAETEIASLVKEDQRPIVIAGVDWVQSLYRKVSKNPQLLASNIRGDIRRFGLLALKEASSYALRELFQKTKKKLFVDFELARSKGKTLSDLGEISKAAVEGRVKKILIARDQVIWGEIARNTGDLRIHHHQMNAKDDDILDNLAEKVMENGGKVLCVPRRDIPDQNVALAIVS